MATIYKSPSRPKNLEYPSIFLAGSIEMGKAEDWQTIVTNGLSDIPNLNIMNPRRDDWDSSWVQTIDNPQFNEQVTWELEMQENADVIIMYFDKDTMAPITLLELGLFGIPNNENMIVCCPDGFYRKGNVDIVCDRYGIKQTNNINDLIEMSRKLIIDIS